jgi:hypothetical protein
MPGGTERGRIARAALAVALGASLAGCAGAQDDATPVPTFPDVPVTTAPAAPGATDEGAIPDDCTEMLGLDDLGALLGLPLGSVTVGSLVGVPAPSVGRTERTDCAYAGTGGGPARGRPLLALNAAAYTNPAAASTQWQLNTAQQDGPHTDLPIGAASGVLVDQAGDTLLTVLYGSGTLTFTLPDRPLPGGATPQSVLVDLAQRILPTIARTAPSATPTPTPTPAPTRTPTPAQAAGTP